VSIFEVILNFLLVVVIINIFTALGVKKRVNEPQDYINKRLWICIILLLVIFITIDFIKVFVAILSPLSSIIFFSSSMSILFVLCSAVNNIVLFTDSSLYLGKYNKEFTFSNIKLYKQNNNNPNDYITIRFTYLGNDYDGVIGKLTFQKMEQLITDYQ
jgi:predicted membrane protein